MHDENNKRNNQKINQVPAASRHIQEHRPERITRGIL
jgi:hypothetical protein